MDILDYAEISSKVYKLEPISDNLLKLYIVDSDKYFNLFNRRIFRIFGFPLMESIFLGKHSY